MATSRHKNWSSGEFHLVQATCSLKTTRLLGVSNLQSKERCVSFVNVTEYEYELLDDLGERHKITIGYHYPVTHSGNMNETNLPNAVSNSEDHFGFVDSRTYKPLRQSRRRHDFDVRKFGSRMFSSMVKTVPLQSSVETVYFRDGRRRIDYVLAYEEGNPSNPSDDKKEEKRENFLENLIDQGLELEKEDKSLSQDGKTYFIKIHTPWDVLAQYAELMSLKMPIKAVEDEDGHKRYRLGDSCFQLSLFDYNRTLIPDDPQYFTSTFNRERASQFVIKDKDTFFTSAQRSRMTWQILLRTPYKFNSDSKIGIIRLLNKGVFKAAFPLHEPKKRSIRMDLESDIRATDPLERYQERMKKMFEEANTRTLLYTEWARPGCWYKRQPLQLIRRYFGVKIGIYFAWLGFYTSMLIPPAVVGVLCFFYGVFTLDDSVPVNDICDESGVGNLIICPLCDLTCPYKHLHESCDFAKVSYLFDNPATVFFSVFMAFWATTFLEFWKRYQSRISWEWDLSHFEDEEETTRPEFERAVNTTRINPVTKSFEPFLPIWNKTLRIIAASSAVIFMVCVVIAAVFGIIVYRVAVVTALHSSSDPFIRENAKITVAVTSALLNLIIILILDKVYQRIAVILTNMEQPRTQTEYENSFTFKMFLFQSVNFYSSLIYIAFFKGGLVVGNPRDKATHAEQCDPSGCLFELCVQLAIIMVGKQILNNFTEIMWPLLLNWWQARKSKANTKQLYTRWEKDYDLRPLDQMTLFNEYLEMVIQYGFVTIFVCAFPLAPLFALLNNIVEIRLDAYKFVTQTRRPMAARANDIGAWAQILNVLSIIAVLVNAFVIAYTSSFIPQMVYLYKYSENNTLHGYVENSLSMFNTSDFKDGKTGPSSKSFDGHDVEVCWYRDYRTPGNYSDPNIRYKLSLQYWHVFAARLAFVVTFEHLVFILTGLLAYIIPDVPYDVMLNLRREKLLAKEALYNAELQKLKAERQMKANQEDSNEQRMELDRKASLSNMDNQSVELTPLKRMRSRI